ncbi:assimilatory sulfite reductase (NADPH) flavoprotein subunit [Jeotgalibacillus sp. ET6]|uniref:assimilatory sulfite reductase (NADPH) flavoprotein subunit n=1 Tax=Jeotgalibacillus sp. ET6 TaxID=3037260 RepID=UPI00241844DC|nr:assimilatory sulfite reductase (NADPH) flavoprotein subunit [Jeotgalibacillus sp. ET6]MDG5473671.1 assimilatory sulfite reductase (NADPH) flavoprotein subunit [Jeotgalibacillus sp. ET6]
MQLQVKSSPFNEEQVELLNRLVPTLTSDQKIWLTGYLTAVSAGQHSEVTAQDAKEAQGVIAPLKAREVTILVGSHTGNGEALADDAEAKLKKEEFTVSRFSLDEFKPKNVGKIEDLLLITSTHGDGDPPDNAIEFYEFLHSKRAPKLDGVRFSVLALGDSSYEFYCQTGKDFDKRIEELGAERMYPRVDCDLDFEEPASLWFDGVLNVLNESKENAQTDESAVSHNEGTVADTTQTYSRSNPFQAEIIENINLNGRGSNKETRHIELNLEGSNLTYEPGDSLGIVPQNDAVLADQLIEAAEWNPNEPVTLNKQGETSTLRDSLIHTFDITSLSKNLIEKAAALTNNEGLKKLLEPDEKESLQTYLYGRDLIDLTQDYGPWEVSGSEFTQILRKIPPRLYSIASSLKANPDEVHLTIGALRYDSFGRSRSGVCSVQCAERSELGDKLPVFVQKNSNFRLPQSADTPIIMIGAGTGVAPYRAFLEEREEIEAQGDAWLFFGEQHFVTDFLYQVEWQKWLKDGLLTRMDVAFSRDTEQKVYVQHRMLEQSRDFYEWLEAGAHVYVCGDEKYMAKDVHEAILTIIQKEGGLNEEQAAEYIADLRSQKRYLRDVY